MDAVAALLDGPRARDAFVMRSTMDPPWSMRVEDEAPLTVIAIVHGRACIAHDGLEPVWLEPGGVAVIRGPDPYTVADDPATAPQIVIHPGQDCRTLAGEDLSRTMALGVRSWGTSAHGATTMITGAYDVRSDVSRRLLDALPRLAVVAADAWQSPLADFLADQVVKDDPGQQAVLDRLLDLLLIAVLRAWLARPEAQAPGWYRAHSDPVVGPALRRLHADPARPWTLAGLAGEIGISRAALARRFTDLVGEPPMTYLTAWRLSLAADLLLEPGATVGSVAPQVGYGSAFALSAAFKRVRGISPAEHRAA